MSLNLGALWTPSCTVFRVWAPDAHNVSVELEASTAEGDAATQWHDASLLGGGVWEAVCPGELEGARYRFRIDDRSTTDPYARSCTTNGAWSAVVRPAPLPRMPRFEGQPIIYEAHVRDLTIGEDNGIAHKGKFLGLAEPRTSTAHGTPTGLEYLRSLGVTHVQLLPIFDFATVDESGPLGFGQQYNWGYDPAHHNAPEGSYATDPSRGPVRVQELKAMIQAMHDAGLRVVVDVVYNHVFDVETSALEATAPGRYFRTLPDGSLANGTGVGNETASEHPLMHEFIVESVRWWATEYAIDGFRFDLMGIHDVATMNAVRAALDAIDPSILIIGEGWSMGNHPASVQRADQAHAHLMPGVAHFNDAFRDAMKGSVFSKTDPGVISGARSEHAMHTLWRELSGQGLTPSVIYNEAHDNATMFDRISATLPHASEQEVLWRCEVATALQCYAKGIMFLHAGQEFGRTKGGDANSYRSGDAVNAFDYQRASRCTPSIDRLRARLRWRRNASLAEYELYELSATRLKFRVDDMVVEFDADRCSFTETPVGAAKPCASLS